MTTTSPAGRPTIAVIDAAAVRANFAVVRAAVAPPVAMLAVVKADAYGHGANLVAPILEAAGADWFGVATLDEGVELRAAGVRKPILLLTGARRGDVPALLEHRIATALLDRDVLHDLAGAPELGERRLAVHIKVDTGMGRLGVLPAELPALADELHGARGIGVDGVFSHFGNSDRVDREFSDYQLSIFQHAVDTLAAAGVRPRWVHLGNSAAAVARPDAHFTMVRPGIILYGVSPPGITAPRGLQPALRLVSRIIQLKAVPSEFPISYGQTYVTRRPSRIAVVPIGYADGYARALSNRAAVLVRGRRAPVIGAVCMDLTMVDVTDVDGVEVGDEVVLCGRQGTETISVNEVAEWQDSVSYEVLTRLGKRIPRVLE